MTDASMHNISIAEMVKMVIGESDNGKVILPTIQRGFVWHPSQIENLWDSILRGYSFGCFTAKKDKNNTYELLDGQQRGAAISLAFNLGPVWNRTSLGQCRFFIDLAKPHENDDRQFILRVITKSHPWGYDLIDNEDRLDLGKIREALDRYGLDPSKDYYEEFEHDNGNRFFPYSAIDPVPFHYFLEDKLDIVKVNKWRQVYKDKMGIKEDGDHTKEELRYLNQYYKKDNFNYKNPEYHELERYSPEELYAIIQNAVFKTKKIALICPEALDDAGRDKDIENMFNRINTAGTQIGVEELNYSILKFRTKGSEEFINNIEEACKDIIHPARFMTIAYRLFPTSVEYRESVGKGKDASHSRLSLDLKIKPWQFQKDMNDNATLDAFKQFIERRILEAEILKKYRDVMKYSSENTWGLPYTLFIKLGKQAPEIVFMVLYRMIAHNDNLAAISQTVIAISTALFFFGRNKRRSNYQRILREIWPCVSKLSSERFWSMETINRAELTSKDNDDVDFRIITPETIEAMNKGKSKETKSTMEYVKSCIFDNKDFLLYAQREILGRWWSKDEGWGLDDTNVPYDFDHIIPSNFIRNQRNINKELREVYNTNGNFRIWPLSLNRIDQDKGLGFKLDPINENNFEGEVPAEAVNFWKECKYFKKNLEGYQKVGYKTVRNMILDDSLCTADWLPEFSKITDASSIKGDFRNKGAQNAYNLILERNLSIYRKWYDLFRKLGSYTEKDFSYLKKLLKKEGISFKEISGKKEKDAGFFDEEQPYLRIADKLYISDLGGYGNEDVIANEAVEVQIGLTDGEFKAFSPKGKAKNFKFYGGWVKNGDMGYVGCLYEKFTISSMSPESFHDLWHEILKWVGQADSAFETTFIREISPASTL